MRGGCECAISLKHCVLRSPPSRTLNPPTASPEARRTFKAHPHAPKAFADRSFAKSLARQAVIDVSKPPRAPLITFSSSDDEDFALAARLVATQNIHAFQASSPKLNGPVGNARAFFRDVGRWFRCYCDYTSRAGKPLVRRGPGKERMPTHSPGPSLYLLVALVTPDCRHIIPPLRLFGDILSPREGIYRRLSPDGGHKRVVRGQSP